jgi:hypothetical protein
MPAPPFLMTFVRGPIPTGLLSQTWTTDLPLDQHIPLGGHTPARGPASSSFSTALFIPPRMDVMFVRHRIASFMDPVIFLHRGALNGCLDFERRPPRSPSSDVWGRERRLARRIRSWYRNEGSRIARLPGRF